MLGTPPLPETPLLARGKSTRKQQYVYDYKQTTVSLHTPDDKLKPHKKEKSPIRQSIKNLLSVLKKGTIGLSKKSDDKLGVPYVGLQSKEEESKGSSSELPTNEVRETLKSRPSGKKQTGSLLYLSGEQGSLAWTTCNVTLEGNKIVLASFTPNMDLYVREIVLSTCADIHSLSHIQLDAHEAALLHAMADGDKMKVFEMLFKGRSKEKFAAKTVRERARWISAIWDAILPVQYNDFPAQEPTLPHCGQDQQNTDTPSLIESPTPTPIPKICSLLSPTYSDRSLPPLPPRANLPPLTIPDNRLRIPSTPTNSGGQQHLYPDTFSPTNTPISPSIYPPTSYTDSPNPLSPSSISPNGVSRPNSPSITNLTQLSVVRQRLAQIERNHSELSVRSGLSRTSTPVSPLSCSASSRKEKVWCNPRASPRSGVTLRGGNKSPTTPTSYVGKKVRRMESEHSLPEAMITDPLANILAQHGQEPVPVPVPILIPTPPPQRDREIQERFEKASLAPLRLDLTKISKDINEVKGVLGGSNGYPTVHQMVVGLERRVQGDEQTLRAIQDSLNSLGDRVVGKLTQIADTQEKEKENQEQEQAAYHNIGQTPSNSEKTAEMETVLAKLEEIRNLCPIQVQADVLEERVSAEPPEYIDKILTFVDDENQKRSVLMQQQADSVRYLNELNTWLEAFVNNGTSQIQGLSSNIDQLCKELGCNIQQQSGTEEGGGGPRTLSDDIHQLLLGMQARDQNFASLQTAVHGLLDVLSASHAQKGANSQAIAELIDRQRRDQETMFRAFTNEISGEIKGERLRFVEAMKEATAINVQNHVEQFKQELSREVMNMTEEVGRLYREKQIVENQISDLFAFYTKQKPAPPPLEMNYVHGHAASQQALPPPAPSQKRVRANTTNTTSLPRSSYHRPLPYPRQL